MQQTVEEMVVLFFVEGNVHEENILDGTYGMPIQDATIGERRGQGFSAGHGLLTWLAHHNHAHLTDEFVEFWQLRTRQDFANELGMAITFVVLAGSEETIIFEQSHFPVG